MRLGCEVFRTVVAIVIARGLNYPDVSLVVQVGTPAGHLSSTEGLMYMLTRLRAHAC
jgi:hypothetical protein